MAAGKWTYRGYDGEKSRPAPIILRVNNWLKVADHGGRDLGRLPSAAHRKANPRSVHNSGRATDWGPSSVEEGNRLMDTLAAYPDGGAIQLVIYRQRQWGGSGGPVFKTTTRHDHDDHLHIETRGWD